MKNALLLLFLLASSHALADVSFNASYRESTNRYQILDCVSEWWSGCQDDGAYRTEWVRRHGSLSAKDLEWFETYKRIRETYLVSANEPAALLLRKDGFFSRGSAAKEDPFQYVFYSARTQEEAYRQLSKLITPAELVWLKKFYEHFEPRTSLFLKESAVPFGRWAAQLNAELANPLYRLFFAKISAFYGVALNLDYEILITWWPPIARDLASPTDRYLVFQKNPVTQMEGRDLDVVFHEVVHTISAHQPKQQKRELTRKFLEICPVEGRVRRGDILEEPLAVALGQIAFLAEFDPDGLHFDASFYNNPWISSFGKAIYPIVRLELNSGRDINQEFIEKAASQCEEFTKAAKLLGNSR